MLFDTGVVSGFLHRNAQTRSPQLVSLVERVARESGLSISIVTQYELRRGVEAQLLKGEGRRLAVAIERFLDAAYVLGLDGHVGDGWSIAASLWARGKVLKPSYRHPMTIASSNGTHTSATP